MSNRTRPLRLAGLLGAIVGFASGVLALYQWFAIGHLSELEGYYACGG